MAQLTVRRYAAIEGGTETEMHVHTETLTGLTAAQARRERVDQLRADGVEQPRGRGTSVARGFFTRLARERVREPHAACVGGDEPHHVGGPIA